MVRRLILALQYPTPIRYQEWWAREFPQQYAIYFPEVVNLGMYAVKGSKGSDEFAPLKASIEYEALQIQELMSLDIRPDDVLLLGDISYPGIFANVLPHINCKKYAICHATAKNRYDYFSGIRKVKWNLEKYQAQLFDKIFVATEYHKNKLGWGNIEVVGLPIPPKEPVIGPGFWNGTVCVASRPGIQKTTKKIEKRLEKELGIVIHRPPEFKSWYSYHKWLSRHAVLLITSKEETFGYQVVDAIKTNTIPLAPNKYSYPELLDRQYLYDDYNDLAAKLFEALDWGEPVPELKMQTTCLNFYKNTSTIMKNNG